MYAQSKKIQKPYSLCEQSFKDESSYNSITKYYRLTVVKHQLRNISAISKTRTINKQTNNYTSKTIERKKQ